jgi:hypothetical protein
MIPPSTLDHKDFHKDLHPASDSVTEDHLWGHLSEKRPIKLQHLSTPRYEVILNDTDTNTMAVTNYQSELGEVDIGMDEA